jgi:integrase
VPISNELDRVLASYDSPRSSIWYFPAPKHEVARWDEDNMSRMLKMVNHRKGQDWTCLDFRHTFGSHLAMNNVSLYKIATLMGNSPEICRRHYAALIPEELTDCVEFMPNVSEEWQPPKLRIV